MELICIPKTLVAAPGINIGKGCGGTIFGMMICSKEGRVTVQQEIWKQLDLEALICMWWYAKNRASLVTKAWSWASDEATKLLSSAYRTSAIGMSGEAGNTERASRMPGLNRSCLSVNGARKAAKKNGESTAPWRTPRSNRKWAVRQPLSWTTDVAIDWFNATN